MLSLLAEPTHPARPEKADRRVEYAQPRSWWRYYCRHEKSCAVAGRCNVGDLTPRMRCQFFGAVLRSRENTLHPHARISRPISPSVQAVPEILVTIALIVGDSHNPTVPP